jgi:hypothetical protein
MPAIHEVISTTFDGKNPMASHRLSFATAVVIAALVATAAAAQEKYEPTWESLSQHSIPEWFQDARFGIAGGVDAGPPIWSRSPRSKSNWSLPILRMSSGRRRNDLRVDKMNCEFRRVNGRAPVAPHLAKYSGAYYIDGNQAPLHGARISQISSLRTS